MERAIEKSERTEATLTAGIVEIPFWHPLAFVGGEQLQHSLLIFKWVFPIAPIWAKLVPRLVASEALTGDKDTIVRIHEQMR